VLCRIEFFFSLLFKRGDLVSFVTVILCNYLVSTGAIVKFLTIYLPVLAMRRCFGSFPAGDLLAMFSVSFIIEFF